MFILYSVLVAIIAVISLMGNYEVTLQETANYTFVSVGGIELF